MRYTATVPSAMLAAALWIAPGHAQDAAPRDVHIVYTGALGGPDAGLYPMEIVRSLRAVEADLDPGLTRLRTVHGAAAQGPVLLIADDGLADTLVRALKGPPLRCAAGVAVPARRTDTESLVMDRPGSSALLDALGAEGLPAEAWISHPCTNDDGYAMHVLRPPASDLPTDWGLGSWELRRALVGVVGRGPDAQPFTVVARPIQESSRLLARALALKAADPDALYVDAGSFLAGVSSVRNDALSLHRPTSWKMLERLAPSALVPGQTELVAGAVAFHEELAQHELPYLATNWTAPGALELPDHRIVTVDTAGGPARIAFVGVLDPALLTAVPRLRDEGVVIDDPVDAVQAVVDRLHALDEPPDAVIALTTARSEVQTELRRRLRGVELLVGDPTMATLRVAERDVRLRPLDARQEAAPLTLPMDGLATAALSFDEQRLTDVRAVPQLIRPELPVDPITTAAITSVRAATYPRLDVPLVPARDPADPLSTWDDAAWDQVVCESVRRVTNADSVLMRPIPHPRDTAGPLTELLVVDHVSLLDRLVLHRVPGDKLPGVLDKAYATDLVRCGAAPGNAKVWGRSIEGGRTYRLVTTDLTLSATPLGEILDGVPAAGPLDPAGVEVLRGPKGNEWTVRMAVLQALRAVREDAGEDRSRPDLDRMDVVEGDAAVRSFLAQAPTARPPEWRVRLRGLAVAVDRFRGTDEPAFAEVPETLATSESSLTLTGEADLALEHDARDLTWDLRYRQAYATVSTAGAEASETADDWRLSTSLEAPVAAFDAGLSWSPFAEVLYDSELTATEDDAGVANPQQRDLSLTVGLAAGARGPLDTLRIGVFGNEDLSQGAGRAPEWGGRAEVATATALGFAKWKVGTSGHVWASTPDDDASDLRFDLLGETSLGLPLARWLALQTYAKGYLLQGRVPENDVVGGAWTLGARLDASGIWGL
ncbi:MAG: hypothetical protein H6742_13090 [Alphaproteobacteria bacterium]|nr:hypothetical protein [Alphaproteobacteria bacterium]